MKSIDPLLDRVYDEDNYHCVHFVIESGQYLFGYDFTHCFLGMTGSLNAEVQTSRHTVANSKRTQSPKDGTVVLMTNLTGRLHVGLYYCGQVLHLSAQGPRFQTLRTLNRLYKRIRFYDAKDFLQRA
ncbi:hypothetical protein PSAR109036_01800 [Psychrobacter arenosus]|uniref:hypothetical protein n=1 Tax=Psychrobacter arenosus TaxID=256326 RepID=UPI0019186B2C|nr:hypothetical protein [Psychrobacter arenosus]